MEIFKRIVEFCERIRENIAQRINFSTMRSQNTTIRSTVSSQMKFYEIMTDRQTDQLTIQPSKKQKIDRLCHS